MLWLGAGTATVGGPIRGARPASTLRQGISRARGRVYRRFYGLDSIRSLGDSGSRGRAADRRSSPHPTSRTLGNRRHRPWLLGSYGSWPLAKRLTGGVPRCSLVSSGLSSGPRADIESMVDCQGSFKRFRALKGCHLCLATMRGQVRAAIFERTGSRAIIEGNIVLLAPLVRWAHYRKSAIQFARLGSWIRYHDAFGVVLAMLNLCFAAQRSFAATESSLW